MCDNIIFFIPFFVSSFIVFFVWSIIFPFKPINVLFFESIIFILEPIIRFLIFFKFIFECLLSLLQNHTLLIPFLLYPCDFPVILLHCLLLFHRMQALISVSLKFLLCSHLFQNLQLMSLVFQIYVLLS